MVYVRKKGKKNYIDKMIEVSTKLKDAVVCNPWFVLYTVGAQVKWVATECNITEGRIFSS
jgi:hypothetical protein